MTSRNNQVFTQFPSVSRYRKQIFTVIALFLVALAMVSSASAAPGDVIRPGFDANILPGNDDGYTGLEPIGFPVNFFGTEFDHLYVNNNGNVTFDAPLATFTPFDLNSTSRIIIAPFFGDVDTRIGNVVTYGQGTVNGRPAFAVNWPDVGCYSTTTSVLNNFQLVLIDRSDIGVGDFDFEFNIAQIQWEAGQASGGDGTCQGGSPARVGYSNGTGTSFELPGSGVAGAFLDSNQATGLIHNSRNSLQDGRYVFEVRNGVAPVGGTISGQVLDGTSASQPVDDALVQVCDSSGCDITTTNASGDYSVSGLGAGQYEVTAFPPEALTNLQPGTIGPLDLASDQILAGQDIVLTGPAGTPAVNGHVRTVDGQPIVGATVTLFRSDSAIGPFEQVPDGSAVMAPSNRTNPDATDADGSFGWQMFAGFYVVRAEADGCVSSEDSSLSFVESGVLTIPPQAADLDLRLDCPSSPEEPEPVNINGFLNLDNVATNFDPAAAPGAPKGVYTITSTFSNSGSDPINDIFFEVAQLSHDNLLLNADDGPAGVGAVLTVDPASLGPDGLLSPGESFIADFEIGLQQRRGFTFLVDAYGTFVSEASQFLSSEAGVDRLSSPDKEGLRSSPGAKGKLDSFEFEFSSRQLQRAAK